MTWKLYTPAALGVPLIVLPETESPAGKAPVIWYDEHEVEARLIRLDVPWVTVALVRSPVKVGEPHVASSVKTVFDVDVTYDPSVVWEARAAMVQVGG